MTDKKKKLVCIVLAVVLSSLCLGLPLLALAQGTEQDNQKEKQDEYLQEYDIQGYDIEGNAILSNDDYIDYMNRMLAERASEGEILEETVKKN